MSISSPINIEFQLNLRDVYRSNVAILVGNLRWLLRATSITVLVVLAGAAFALTAKQAGFPFPIGLGGLWGVLFVPLFLLYICLGAPYFAAKSLIQQSPNFQGTIRYSFSDDFVAQEMVTGRAQLQWSTFLRVRETSDLFLLYVQKHLAHPVPKRAFASEQEIAAFRDLVRRHVQRTDLRA